MECHSPTLAVTYRKGFAKVNQDPNLKDNENRLDDVYLSNRDEAVTNLYQYAPEIPRSVALRGKFVHTDGSDLNEIENVAGVSQTQANEVDQRFDDLEDIDSYEIGEPENEIANPSQSNSDLRFSYEELARKSEMLQQRCMALS